jgi:hypothetical protein
MKRLIAWALWGCVAAQISVAAEPGWIGPNAQPAPESAYRRSVGGFGGWLVVTPDQDWEAKWNTPATTVPQFTTADEVHVGKTLTILIFYGNPRSTAAGAIDIQCDIRVIRPDGTRSVDAHDVDCASGKIQGSPTNLRLSNRLLKFVGEFADPLGTWTIEVTFRDKNAQVAVPLRTTFKLIS